YALRELSAQAIATVLRRAIERGTEEEEEEEEEEDGENGANTETEVGAETHGGDRRAGKDARTPDGVDVEGEAIEFLAARSAGDARTALNALELALETAMELGEPKVGIARVEDALQRRAVLYDKQGDRHYDYISAWIKATRGSDPDASLYYLAVMLEGGEDPRFIVR